MSSQVRPWGRDSRRRPPAAPPAPEILEVRALPSSGLAGLLGTPTPTPSTGLPTVLNLKSVAATAESGQAVPLVASVNPTGTAAQLRAAGSQTISGTIYFYTTAPRRIPLGQVAINPTQSSSIPLLSAVQSTFGMSNQQGAVGIDDTAFLWTKKLRADGTYTIEARFVPANRDFAASTSVVKILTITSKTQDAPTVTSLQVATNSAEAGAYNPFTVTVQNPDSSLAGGVVKLTTVSPHPIVLGKTTVGRFDQSIDFSSNQLQVGTYQVQAVYLPSSNRFAESTSPPITVTVTPLTAVSFRVTPVVPFGWLNQPLSYRVTALNAQGQPLTDYTGTIVMSSPTDSWTILPPAVYTKLGILPPSNDSPLLASFVPASYTFTTADHGSHLFTDGVQFGKGGMESLQVTQANDPEVSGKTVFAIAPKPKPSFKYASYYRYYGYIDGRRKKG